MIGRTVSHYRILEELGSGGMGVVYRATDLRLGREVALKFLPENLTRDAAAVERFEREARAAAAITHPNICTVYEIGEYNGLPFISMELLEGETLKKRIGSDLIPVDTLLDWAIQITQGLEAAHARGIAHRDLKPANLFITKIGQIKILDFGVVKLLFPRKPVATGSGNTMTVVGTDPGSPMGTPAYMSPEQARGDEVDVRTDLFSLGVVLYEMATGNLPFQGSSTATVIASLLRDTPRRPRDFNQTLPVELDRVITRALEKDPETRYQTAADLRSDLRRVKREIGFGATEEPLSSSFEIPVRNRRTTVLWLLAAITVIIWSTAAIFGLARPLPPPRVLSTTQITSDHRPKSAPFLTDGSRLYFNTGNNIAPQPYEVSVEGGESVPVPLQLPNAWLLDISRDRSQILAGSFGQNPYSFNVVTLWTAPVLGGSPRRIDDLVVGDASWSPDGQELVFTREGEKELDIARSDGTGIRKLITVQGIPSSPRWSPDERTIRFTVRTTYRWSTVGNEPLSSTVWEISTNGSHLHAMFPDRRDSQCCGNWTRDGKYFVFQATSNGVTTIWASREKRRWFERVSHQPVQLTTGPTSTYGPTPSLDGKRLFVAGSQPRIELIRYDMKSEQFVPFFSRTSAEGLDFSKDGKWVTYASYPEQTLWRSTVNGEERLQLTVPPLRANLPRWSPDGTRIAFMGFYPGQREKIFLIRADGGELQQLTSGENNSDPTWSPDGNSLAFGGYPLNAVQASKQMAVQVLDLTTRRVSTLPGSEGFWSPRWSPDGHYVAALSTDTQTLLFFDFRTSKWTDLARANFGYPSWSRDSQYIYFDTIGEDAAIFRVRIRDRKVERIVSLKKRSTEGRLFGSLDWPGPRRFSSRGTRCQFRRNLRLGLGSAIEVREWQR